MKLTRALALIGLCVCMLCGCGVSPSPTDDTTGYSQTGGETQTPDDPTGATEEATEDVTEPATEETAAPTETGGSGETDDDKPEPETTPQTKPPKETKPQETEPEETKPVVKPPRETEPEETEPEATVHQHSYSRKTVKPTCTERGYDQYTCSCGDSYKNNYQEAKGHSYTDTTVQPTCTEQGYTQHKCGACGDSYTDAYTDALGHNWGEWVTIKEPTTSEEGTKERSCTRCGKKETAAIEKKEAEKIDTATLEAYGRRYAYETYGYDGNPNCNPSTNAGYFPGASKYIYSMEEGYKYVREAVDTQYVYDVAAGKTITKEIDGVLRRRPLNVYLEPTSTPNQYIIWVYYGGHADPYCD